MKAALRLFAQPVRSKFLDAGVPTGLTGLFTHPAPRSTLIYLYTSTLDKLKGLPESSVYRQSTEALTKHRLSIVEKVKPEGYDEWSAKVKKTLAEHPDSKNLIHTHQGRQFYTFTPEPELEQLEEQEWDGEEKVSPTPEGPRAANERKGQVQDFGLEKKLFNPSEKKIQLDAEPPLSAEQIVGLENELAAGLIEEVIQVAEGELKLVDSMAESRPWEELVEKAPHRQWEYFERGAHTKTQAP